MHRVFATLAWVAGAHRAPCHIDTFQVPLDLDNPAHLDALRRASERFPEGGAAPYARSRGVEAQADGPPTHWSVGMFKQRAI
jgi:hypothetical protein